MQIYDWVSKREIESGALVDGRSSDSYPKIFLLFPSHMGTSISFQGSLFPATEGTLEGIECAEYAIYLRFVN